MEKSISENQKNAIALSDLLRSKGVKHTSIVITEKTVIIHGCINHLPRIRENLCRSLNLCYDKSSLQHDKKFSVFFTRLNFYD